MSTPTPAMQALLDRNNVPGSRVVAFMVPTRIIRILQIDEAGHTFRVQQLAPNPDRWIDLSTHTNAAVPWEAYGVAMDAAVKAQLELIRGLKARIEARNKPLPGRGGPPLVVPKQGIAQPVRRAAYDVRIK